MTVLAPTNKTSTALAKSTTDADTRDKMERWIARGLVVRLRRLVNTLAGTSDLKVGWRDSGPATAWTDMSTVFINRSYFDLTDPNCVEDIYTVVLHELGHVLFSPRPRAQLSVAVREKVLYSGQRKAQRAFNILEDCRNETILSRRWPTTQVWFTNSTIRIVLKGTINEQSWVFTAGREFLPQRLQTLSRAAFDGDAQRLLEITLEYNRLKNPNKQHERALELILEFAALIPEHIEGGCGGDRGQDDHSGNSEDSDTDLGDPPTDEGEPSGDPGEEADTDPGTGEPGDDSGDGDPTADEDGDNTSAGGSDEAEDGESEDGESGGEPGDTDGGNGESGDGEGESGGDSGGESSDGGESTDGDGGNGATDGNPEADLPNPSEVLDEILDETRDSREFQDALDSYDKALDEGMSADESDLAQWDKKTWTDANYDTPVSDEHRNAANVIARLLKEITSRVRPGWQKHRRTGTFDVPTYVAKSQRPVRVFKKYSPGQLRAIDIHVEVLVDQSGSMSFGSTQNDMKAVAMAHTIKVACDKIGATCGVHMFGSHATTLWTATEKADASTVPYYSDGGGTNVGGALWEAVRTCTVRDATVKLVLILTDGAYSDYYAGDVRLQAVMSEISNSGARSHLFLLSGANMSEQQVEAERELRFTDTAHHVHDVDSVIDYFRSTLVHDMKKVLATV